MYMYQPCMVLSHSVSLFHSPSGPEWGYAELQDVNLPGKDVGLPAISDRDKSDLTFGVEYDVDVIGLLHSQ